MQKNIEKVYVVGTAFSNRDRLWYPFMKKDLKDKLVWINNIEELDTVFRPAAAALPIPFYISTDPETVSALSEPLQPGNGAPEYPLRPLHLEQLWEQEVNRQDIRAWEYIPFTFFSSIASIISLDGLTF